MLIKENDSKNIIMIIKKQNKASNLEKSQKNKIPNLNIIFKRFL